MSLMRILKNKMKQISFLLSLMSLSLIILLNNKDLKIPKNDYTPNSFLLTTSSLPRDKNQHILTKMMPYVGNGHLASTVFDNSVFLNGLYNGEKTNSHRARVPNVHNFSFFSNDDKGFQNTNYILDMEKGQKTHSHLILKLSK